MHTFSNDLMLDEIKMVTRLQEEARHVPEDQWADWVNQNKDSVRLAGNDGSVPDQEEWIKRCESFLVVMGKPFNRSLLENAEQQIGSNNGKTGPIFEPD